MKLGNCPCVNSGIEIPLGVQCKILQHKILWQFPMEVQDFFSLCKIHQPVWIQVDHRNKESSELWLFRPLYNKIGKHAFRAEFFLWQIFFRVFIEPCENQDWFNSLFLLIQTQKSAVNNEINKLMHALGVEYRHLVAGFENAWATGSRFERVGRTKFLRKSSIFFANSRNFFHIFLRPQCTFGIKNTKTTNTGTPPKMVLFQKTWRKRAKEYSFNLFTERAIVEDCVAVILPPQLTL